MKMFCVTVLLLISCSLSSDAPPSDHHQGCVRERPGRRAEVHPESQPVPVRVSQGARLTGGEESGAERDISQGEWFLVLSLI